MGFAFLLRFQEPCQPEETQVEQNGTQTSTRAKSDSDSDAASLDSLHSQTGKTRTAIKAEQPDDHVESANRAIPVAGKTFTAIKGEHQDQSAGWANHIIPKSPQAKTQTATYVRQEADDEDAQRMSLRAISSSGRRTFAGTQTITKMRSDTDGDPGSTQRHLIPRCS